MADLAKLWRSGQTIFTNSGVKARKRRRDIDGKRGRVKDGKRWRGMVKGGKRGRGMVGRGGEVRV